MKKALVLILVLCIVASLVFCLAACSDSKAPNNSQPSNSTTPSDQGGSGSQGGSQQGGDQGGSQQGGDNGGSQSGNQQSGGDNGSSQQGGGNQTVLTVTLPTIESILAAIGTNFKVSATSSAGAPTTVAFDGVYEYVSTTSVRFSKKIGDLYYPYSDLRDGKYHKMGTPNYYPEDSLGIALGSSTVGKMLQFAGETISYQEVTTLTFLGRPAQKYVFESDNAYGYNEYFHEEITIDDATGVCLQYDMEGRAGAGFTGSTRDKVNVEVTELEYGANNSVVRAFLDEMIAKIDVYEWDTDFMQAIGLSAVNAPDWSLWSVEWYSRTSRTDAEPYLDVFYRYYTDNSAATIDDVRALLQAFYNAGAKLDDSGTEQTFDELYSFDDDERTPSLYFTGYIVGNETYYVQITADYIYNASPKYWRIEIEFQVET